MNEQVPKDVWEAVISMRPVVEQARDEADALRRLPEVIEKAFVERDIYRLLLPQDLGGRELDPIAGFDLVEEVSNYDGSVGWNFAIGINSGMMAGVLPREIADPLFATADAAMAGSGPPQGRAVAVEGGYRVTGKFAWASGIYQAGWVMGGCFAFDGDEMRKGPQGGPVVFHVLMPIEDVTILDTWKTGGMRGTGSTEFVAEDVFVPDARVFSMFGSEPTHPSPIYRLPTTNFGFLLTAVPLGIARATIAALIDLAERKKVPPPRVGLNEQPYTQYVVGKATAMVNAARLGVRDAFATMWREVREQGEATMPSRAALRGASVHAVEASIEAVQMCYRAAGGNALFESERFERALRDVNATGGHIVFQRAMMEDVGRAAMGLPPLLAMF